MLDHSPSNLESSTDRMDGSVRGTWSVAGTQTWDHNRPTTLPSLYPTKLANFLHTFLLPCFPPAFPSVVTVTVPTSTIIINSKRIRFYQAGKLHSIPIGAPGTRTRESARERKCVRKSDRTEDGEDEGKGRALSPPVQA